MQARAFQFLNLWGTATSGGCFIPADLEKSAGMPET
jgi:hypothetical protein